MKKFNITVKSMSAIYHGEIEAESKLDAIQKVKEEYRKNGDSRASWEIIAYESNS